MPFRDEQITVRSDRPESWRLVNPVVYEGRDELFRVPAGLPTDFASVPRVFTWLVPRYGVYTRAAILHDYLSRSPHLVSRADADGIFRRVLRELGVSFPRRWLMWAAVRVGSGMRGATGSDWMKMSTVALFAVLLLLVPVTIVQLWIWLFRLIEWVGRARHKP